MHPAVFDIIAAPFVEALTVLDVEFKIDGNRILVSRDSMVKAFSRAFDEDASYKAVYYEIFSYVGNYFYWMKLGDDWYLIDPVI